ncbi:MAG TPA: ABC transporter ATP-binding protein [Bryobacteraceae bacterium]|nr:ABC transporter ATP-binding protein [Bryobacteraceae bacterium]
MSQAAESIALRVRALRKAYADVVAVDHLDLDVYRGECFGLLGPNGAGKTTTIEICEGLTDPDSGTVELLGRTWRRNAAELKQLLGIQLQETQFGDKLTVRETVTLFRSFYQRGPSVDEVISLVQLEQKRDSRVGQLSGGQKQRLAMACALVGDPEFLFLDEPSTGLDPQARRQVWDLIEGFKATGRTILLTTHYMDEAEKLCDRVGIMDRGRIIALDTPRALIASLRAEHVVQFAVAGGDGPFEADGLRAIAGVLDLRHSDGAVEMQVEQLHQTLPAVLQAIAARRCSLTQLSTHSATLEDVFVSLTGRHLRDE